MTDIVWASARARREGGRLHLAVGQPRAVRLSPGDDDAGESRRGIVEADDEAPLSGPEHHGAEHGPGAGRLSQDSAELAGIAAHGPGIAVSREEEVEVARRLRVVERGGGHPAESAERRGNPADPR